MFDRWLAKLERRHGRYALGNLTYWLIGLQALGLVLVLSRPDLAPKMLLDRDAVFAGEWWRLFTFVLYPMSRDPIMFMFGAYWLYMMGTALETKWGAFYYEVYWATGVVFTLLSVFLGGHTATIAPLVMALFHASATLWPDYETLVFFIIPVRAKWLA